MKIRRCFKARKVVGVFNTDQRDLSSPPPVGLRLRTRTIQTKEERVRFDQLLEQKHYLGCGQPTGDFVRQLIEDELGNWLALLTWGSACYQIKDRDQWIGWSNTQRAERQKLVIQNRRFLLLVERGKHPNLGSQALGLAVRKIGDQWQTHFGYRPVLAETFSDIELFEGTCYKASGWEAVGMSKGYARHRAEFYIKHDRPKKLWLKKLQANAKEVLCSLRLPSAQLKGSSSNAQGQMPLKTAQQKSLYQVMEQLDDHRATNASFKLSSVLCIVAMALLCGAKQVSEIYRFGLRLSQAQRRNLKLPVRKATVVRRAPGYSVYYQMLRKIVPQQMGEVLTQWLQAHQGSLPSALALDGKMIGELVGIISLVDHETGVPVAMAPMGRKLSDENEGELKTAQKLLQSLKLDNTLISADALHTQKETARITVEQGGDDLFQIKENQPKLMEFAKKQFEPIESQPPLFANVKKDMAESTPVKSEASVSTPPKPTSHMPKA